ncbi:exodeoxyribonuclease VII, small subunit [Eggerthia catenaformis OT 569 = DSM 20559]|uniref:Exodeoxyribonuclease 7 small subunit n=1 Tax=Eggerthia catenaformis OT 569 = DSM 20559 TaxID=999415 RepID=M2P9J4_9FIRM|nr:exodeoxyribonuclease VII small subunit [Eggerthia catenaformis]EMD16997.1 exodeoxyribonuclease VII, small subunit [Eggerthia catenaformis OT 569 = DSM 20559]OUC51905.1 exodeoxyribonuclease VII small subunit [Eggerthia catenaformis]
MNKKYTYEEAMNRLEEIISILEKNEVSLDESIKLYEEGIALSKYCDDKLKNIEDRVIKIFEDNQLKSYEGETND